MTALVKLVSDLITESDQAVRAVHSCISWFTIEYSRTEIPFLDVLVKKRGTNIHTDVYCKPTDSKQYLMFNYCHTKHIKTSIPYSLARRLRLIVSDVGGCRN